MFPYQRTFKNLLKDSAVIYQQKPIMCLARERKRNFIRLALRERQVFTIFTDGFYGCGTYKMSNDTVFLQYFEHKLSKSYQDFVILNVKDSTAQIHWFKKTEDLVIGKCPIEQ
jgi:hypothetical protein